MHRVTLVVLGLLMAVLSVSQARSAIADAIALLTSISGKVEITKSQTRSKRLAAIGDRLFENDILQTRKNATASLLFTDGTIVKIFSNTRLSLTLKAKSEAMGSRQIGPLSKGILKGVKDIFSGETKKETLTAVPGLRKKIEGELGESECYTRETARFSQQNRLFAGKPLANKGHLPSRSP